MIKNKKLLCGTLVVCGLAMLMSVCFPCFGKESDIAKAASNETEESVTSVEKDLEATARNFVELMSKEKYKEACKFFDEAVAEAMSPERLKATWENLIAQVGEFKEIVKARTTEENSWKVVYVTSEFAETFLDIKLVFDEEKMISGLWLIPVEIESEPSYSPPEYGDPDSFREIECLVGSGEWKLPGTLSVPKGEGPFSAVVLVHGSGPNDRDETIGPNKPFKDLAWGLASEGVAVLRYEKRTKQYPSKMVSILKDLTVEEETIYDALAAVDLLREREGIDPDRIFILGHSFGGMLAPRIAAEGEGIAGLILLAANTRSLPDIVFSQSQYIAFLDGKIDREEAKYLKEIEQVVEKVKELNIGEEEIILGAPRAYWADLMAYNPVEMASELTLPMLILQGKRDYQVTVEDFQGWREGLPGNEKVEFKFYLELNHLFVSGSGKSTPAEYNRPGNVAQVIIEDIAEWIKSQ